MSLLVVAIMSCAAKEPEPYGRRMDNIAKHFKLMGLNRFIDDPVFADLDGRAIRIQISESFHTDPVTRQIVDRPHELTPRGIEMLSAFGKAYDHDELMRLLAISRMGGEAAAAQIYTVQPNSVSCQLDDPDAVFQAQNDQPLRVPLTFVSGGCRNGLADGIAEAKSADGSARFVGHFTAGRMDEGVFHATLDDGTRLVQIGGVAHAGQIARALASFYPAQDTDTSSVHRFGDYDDQGLLNGFAINLVDERNRLDVVSAGQFRDSKLNGAGVWHGTSYFFSKTGKHVVRLGQFRDDKLDGKGAMIFDFDEARYTAVWKADRITGVRYFSSWDGRIALNGGWLMYQEVGAYNESSYATGPHTWINYNDKSPKAITGAQTHYGNGRKRGKTRKLAFKGSEIVGFKQGFDFGKLVAIAGVATVAGSSGMSVGNAAAFTGVFAGDVMMNTGGRGMQAVQSGINDARVDIAETRRALSMLNEPANEAETAAVESSIPKRQQAAAVAGAAADGGNGLIGGGMPGLAGKACSSAVAGTWFSTGLDQTVSLGSNGRGTFEQTSVRGESYKAEVSYTWSTTADTITFNYTGPLVYTNLDTGAVEHKAKPASGTVSCSFTGQTLMIGGVLYTRG